MREAIPVWGTYVFFILVDIQVAFQKNAAVHIATNTASFLPQAHCQNFANLISDSSLLFNLHLPD